MHHPEILHKFQSKVFWINLFVTDFYDQLNENSEATCYQEFGSFDLEDIKKLRTLIGKRFYAVPYTDEDGEEYYNMVIE